MHRNGAVAPRIFQLVAAIRHVNDFNIERSRRLLKTARLVTQLVCEEQQRFDGVSIL